MGSIHHLGKYTPFPSSFAIGGNNGIGISDRGAELNHPFHSKPVFLTPSTFVGADTLLAIRAIPELGNISICKFGALPNRGANSFAKFW